MTIKDINDKIISDAKIQASKIITQAEDNANNIIKKGEKEADNVKKIILYKINQEASLKKSKILTEANLEAKKTILLEKQKIMEDVFDKALESITKLNSKDYLNFIKKLILDNIERGDETIFTGSSDKNKICKDFIEEINKELKAKDKKGELRLSTSYLPIKGGVVIGSGKIRKNISLEFLLKKIREELEIQISKDLFN
ncbi:MAG: V-type ATP synthase subunit E [Candidatus Atribacteria bacterium]|nr:V-type ATP synthase subunit E [Candidatus Atribacteria bacterium]